MKFYCVTYRDEGSSEGMGGRYFRTKKEAQSFASRMRRELMEPVECPYCGATVKPPQEKCPDCGEFWHYTQSELGEIEIETIELTGTCRDMCWQALHHQIVPQ